MVLAITERRDMGLYEVHMSISLLGFGSSFKHTREKWEFKRAYFFSCLIFSLSGPCELLF